MLPLFSQLNQGAFFPKILLSPAGSNTVCVNIAWGVSILHGEIWPKHIKWIVCTLS